MLTENYRYEVKTKYYSPYFSYGFWVADLCCWYFSRCPLTLYTTCGWVSCSSECNWRLLFPVRSPSFIHDPAEILHHSIVVNNNSNSVVWRGPAFTFWPLLKAYLCAGQNPVQATQCVWKRTVLGTDLLTEYDTCHHAVVLTLSCLLLATVYCTVTVTPVPRITAAGKREKPLYTRDPRS